MTGLSQLAEFDNCCRMGETTLWPGWHYYRQGNILDAWRSQPGLYCLKQGKQRYNAVDQAQQVDTQDRDASDEKGFLHCAECQYPITRKIDRTEINEKHQHVFANPHGYIYQIGCFVQALGCVAIGEEARHFSWFPGYTWRIALCGRCLTLLGWAFRSHESQFFGLILDKLTQTS